MALVFLLTVWFSLYQNENLLSDQYGGDQRDFTENFPDLIHDPLIWEEMQKYYPVSDFSSEEAAMDFYDAYFRILTKCGCGYIAAVNRIFQLFEKNPERFE